MSYTLTGADGRLYSSEAEGQRGGYRSARIYGRLDCPSALCAITRGGYARHRVFFADESAALAAGYRPCAVCLFSPWISLWRSPLRR
jgi:methylphosphotriester-DNA--protein-cysteine methyltransferase